MRRLQANQNGEIKLMKTYVKRICAALLFCAFLLSFPFSFGCSSKNGVGELNIVCTVFPLYDWTRNVVGDSDRVNVQLLVKNGADVHSFQPSFADAAAIKNSDVVIYVGGESDSWVEQSIPDGTLAIKLSELDGITLREICSDSLAHDHSNHEHGSAFDEHLWLSAGNAITACKAISNALSGLDGNGAYLKNTDAYVAELEAINTRMMTLSECISEALIFADRFPFVYFLEDFGIDYYAAYEGCSTEKDANIDTVVELTKRIKTSSVSHIFTTESPDKALVDNTLKEVGSSVSVVILDSMQSVSEKELDDASYVDIMRSNVSALEKIFNK